MKPVGPVTARGVVTMLLFAMSVHPAAAQTPEYSSRLRMPSLLDELGSSKSVTVDFHTNEIFVGDVRRQRIVIFDRQGFFSYQIPGGEIFRAPLDLAVDPRGFILVLSSAGLIWLDFDGADPRSLELSDFDAVHEPELVSVALSATGDHIFALDQANQVLWMADRDGTVTGRIDLALDLDDKQAFEFRLGHVDVYGDTILIAMPSAGLVRLYGLDGSSQGFVGLKGTASCQTGFPVAAALGADGTVVVLDQQRMLFTVWNRATNRCLGEYSGIGNAPGFVYQPADLALDNEGRIYVSQGYEGRVQVFSGGPPAAR